MNPSNAVFYLNVVALAIAVALVVPAIVRTRRRQAAHVSGMTNSDRTHKGAGCVFSLILIIFAGGGAVLFGIGMWTNLHNITQIGTFCILLALIYLELTALAIR
jgi:hypothetical protein